MIGPRAPRRRFLSRAVALLGVGLTAATLTGCALIGPDPAAGADQPTGSDVFAIVVGDCLDDADTPAEVHLVTVVDCTGPHDSEVFARTVLTGGAYPGAESLEQSLTAFCRGEAFTEFVGEPLSRSIYQTKGYHPTEASWRDGDRELLCTVVADSGEQLTGSLAGVAR